MEDVNQIRQRVTEYVRRHGPILPVKIAKEINTNILMAGAILSELVANKKILISSAKIGGSPVYYYSGQEARLSILFPYLQEKERKACELLREKKVLRDKDLEPYQRVALRGLKDFAVMLNVVNDEIFWKWYLVSDKEADSLIGNILEEIKEKVVEEEIPEEVEVKVVKPEVKVEVAKVKPEIKERIEVRVKPEIKEREIDKKKVKAKEEKFDLLLEDYFRERGVKIIETIVKKKNKEFDYIADVPSGVGYVKFFIRSKDKRKISDSDLSLAHNENQLKRLPLLFLATGELTKKGKEYIDKNYLVFERVKQ